MRSRARDLGLIIGSLPVGSKNSITDISGVSVGHSTIIKGDGKLKPGLGPVRTGVTAILPHNGHLFKKKVLASTIVINGFGKTIGLPQIEELGQIETPILLTNTLSVPRVADALIDYMIERNPKIGIETSTVNPVVAECNDSFLNDIQGRHVKKEHVFEAISKASDYVVAEGNVGAGTGMSCFEFKGGIGTSSRLVGDYTLGSLVLSNFGKREDLSILGILIGKYLPQLPNQVNFNNKGSIIVILATDAPFDNLKLSRLGKRVPYGLARVGSHCSNGSGDFVVSFTTSRESTPYSIENSLMDLFFRATIEVVEEAVLNSLFMAETMVGRDNHKREAFPVEKCLAILKERT